jgi:hypothetical protein
MHFASLHGVFDHVSSATKYPPEGLRGFSRPDLKRSHNNADTPQYIGVTPHRPEQPDPELRYYPDPAASLLVLALKQPESEPSSGWLGDPFVVSTNAGMQWPDAVPVLLELEAIEKGAKDSLRLLDGGTRSAGGTGGPAVRVVRCMLQPGEDVEVLAWFVPTVGQLANWFDGIQAASLLATYGGSPQGPSDSGNACARGLKALVGKKIDGKISPAATKEIEKVCTGTGNMAVPSERAMRQLAALVHQTMLHRPISTIATTLSMRLTHAMDEAFVSAPHILPGTLKLARRKFTGGDGGVDPAKESRLDFIEKLKPSEWDVRYSEEGALGALFAGRLRLDRATTSALEIEVECAGPDSDKLDDESRGRGQDQKVAGTWPDKLKEGDEKLFGFGVGKDHTVKFPRRRVMAFRIDGLPLPADCRAGLRDDLSLEQLQSASWGAGKSLGQALRTSLAATLKTTGARLLRVRPVALARHAGLMPKLKAKAATRVGVAGDFQEIWLPSTTRPAPPCRPDSDWFSRTSNHPR